ncbi:DUF29 family protein [Methylobacterium bullatum]|uniref:Uncharacterized protein n=1 Tax=Methylobacterium bullatum TaxID=570505 RepID=A0AAV4Z5S5_9HYPH|nr:DUF29 family protein [Methylobacterium bullatum]MBD8902667.1 hypothetical protein [Methylobacterium bullatum]GJD39330.1 hypothetical protein OICFNHDK_1789 [Methylobacterium bullatum]
MDQPSLYDDIVSGTEQRASALRSLSRRSDLSNMLDGENVAEEIERVGRSQVQTGEGLLTQSPAHLLERRSSPCTLPVEHWRREVEAFQIGARGRCEPSMSQRIDWFNGWAATQELAKPGRTAYGNTLISNLPFQCSLDVADPLVTPFYIDDALLRIAETTILKSLEKH